MALRWREPLGLPQCPYLYRWMVETRFGSLRIHHWHSSDDDRAFHDHPWWFLTFVVKGGYTDVSPEGEDEVNAPALRFRRALHQHTVKVHPGGAWTILITGPEKRMWGFWVKKRNGKPRFLAHKRYFYRHGHHPCD